MPSDERLRRLERDHARRGNPELAARLQQERLRRNRPPAQPWLRDGRSGETGPDVPPGAQPGLRWVWEALPDDEPSDTLTASEAGVFGRLRDPGWKRDELFALSPDGVLRWRQAAASPGIALSPPRLSLEADAVYAACGQKVLALEADSGQVRWQVQAPVQRHQPRAGPASAASRPLVGPDETVYALTALGNLVSILPNGERAWSVVTDHSSGGDPLALDPEEGYLYLTRDQTRLVVYRTTGRWRRDLDFHDTEGQLLALLSGPVLGPDGEVYLLAQWTSGQQAGTYLLRRRAVPRQQHWEKRLLEGVEPVHAGRLGRPALFEEHVLASVRGLPGLARLERRSGEVLGSGRDPDEGTLTVSEPGAGGRGPRGPAYPTAPVVDAHGVVYVSLGGGVEAYDPDGQRRWRIELDPWHELGPPTIGPGCLYLTVRRPDGRPGAGVACLG